MAQIFISHSGRDKELVDFFSNCFAGTKVKAIFEEIEKLLNGKIVSSQITKDIEDSNALFVILSQNVQNIPHTRDWVVWETGVARNRDIWVFEPYLQTGRISIITPYLKHYVLFDRNDPYLGYIRKIIESYDDSHVLSTILLTTGIGALFAKTEGATLGALAGAAITNRSKERPAGSSIKCNKCFSSYSIHIPQRMESFRCPVCNKFFKIRI